MDVAISSVNYNSLVSTAVHTDMNECINTSCQHSNYTDGAANVCLNNVHGNG